MSHPAETAHHPLTITGAVFCMSSSSCACARGSPVLSRQGIGVHSHIAPLAGQIILGFRCCATIFLTRCTLS